MPGCGRQLRGERAGGDAQPLEQCVHPDALALGLRGPSATGALVGEVERLVRVALEVVQLVLGRDDAGRVEIDRVLPAPVANATDPVRLARRLLERRRRLMVVVREQHRLAELIRLPAQQWAEIVSVGPAGARRSAGETEERRDEIDQ